MPGVTKAVETATAQVFRDTYAYAYRHMFWCTIPFGVLAIIAACFIGEPSAYLTNYVAVHMEKKVVKSSAKEEKADAQQMAYHSR